MKLYKTNKYNNNIEEREVTKVTDKSIFYIYKNTNTGKETDERELKVTNYNIWHDTKGDAIEFLINRSEKKVEYHKRELSKSITELEELRTLAITNQ